MCVFKQREKINRRELMLLLRFLMLFHYHWCFSYDELIDGVKALMVFQIASDIAGILENFFLY